MTVLNGKAQEITKKLYAKLYIYEQREIKIEIKSGLSKEMKSEQFLRNRYSGADIPFNIVYILFWL